MPATASEPIPRDTPKREAALEGSCPGLLGDVGPIPGLVCVGVGLSVAVRVGSGEEGSLLDGPPKDAGGAGGADFEEPGAELEEAGGAGAGGAGGAALLGAGTGAGTGAGDEGSHEVSTGGGTVLWAWESDGGVAGVVGWPHSVTVTVVVTAGAV